MIIGRMKLMLEKLTDMDLKILIAFADNDMNLSKTGRQIYMHRNSIDYHLQRIEEKTGLNPLKFYDLVKLLKIDLNKMIVKKVLF